MCLSLPDSPPLLPFLLSLSLDPPLSHFSSLFLFPPPKCLPVRKSEQETRQMITPVHQRLKQGEAESQKRHSRVTSACHTIVTFASPQSPLCITFRLARFRGDDSGAWLPVPARRLPRSAPAIVADTRGADPFIDGTKLRTRSTEPRVRGVCSSGQCLCPVCTTPASQKQAAHSGDGEFMMAHCSGVVSITLPPPLFFFFSSL